jgi:hypothetical protein
MDLLKLKGRERKRVVPRRTAKRRDDWQWGDKE